MYVVVKDSETVFDIAIRAVASIEGAFDIVKDNAIDWTDPIPKQTRLLVDTSINIATTSIQTQYKKVIKTAYEYTVKDNQSLFDIVLQELGGFENIFELLLLNDLSINDRLDTNAILKIETKEVVNKKVLKYIQVNRLVIATSNTLEDNVLVSNLLDYIITNLGQKILIN